MFISVEFPTNTKTTNHNRIAEMGKHPENSTEKILDVQGQLQVKDSKRLLLNHTHMLAL